MKMPPAKIQRGRTATQPEPDIAPEISEDEPEQGPLRRCLVTREQGERRKMLRFAVAPEGRVVFDAAATLPGRGLWLSARHDVLHQAALVRRLTDFLGLARRSGVAISGFEKAREWLQAGKAGLVLQAADGSAEERARFLGGRDVPVVAVLDAATLGRVFGRDRAVHVVVQPGKLANMIEIDAQRLAGVAADVTSGQ